jgi:hypothetical protein
MQYLIARDGQQLGQFSEEEIRSGLFEGRYLPTDVAWAEGMTDWKPLGEIMGQGVTRLAGPRGPGPGFSGESSPPTRTVGLAIAALVLGILSMLTCGGLGLGAVAAIICGHMALTTIGKARGALGGRGMALAGLIMGYASVLLVGVSILASLSMATIGKMGEKGQVVKGIADARQTALGIRQYAADRQGKYPASLEELVIVGALQPEVLAKLQSFKPSGWQNEAGFEYRGANMKDSSPGDMVLLISRCQDARGKRVVVTNDTAVELRMPPSP